MHGSICSWPGCASIATSQQSPSHFHLSPNDGMTVYYIKLGDIQVETIHNIQETYATDLMPWASYQLRCSTIIWLVGSQQFTFR